MKSEKPIVNKEFYYSYPRPEMLRYIDTGVKNILEFGCADGSFAAKVKEKFDCNYIGVEPLSKYANIARTRLNYVYEITAEEFISSSEGMENKYDVVIFNDVLEHLIDPYTLLKDLRMLLTQGGKVVASIPNFLNFQNIYSILRDKDFKYSEHGILDKTHLRFFTKRSIERLFNESGYNIEIIEGINCNIKSKKFKALNLITNGYLDEFKFMQFAIVAVKK
ncbi:class I SAM-dependent methyltransferase [Nibrella saemangeumensis]|uniref:Class I SAM-dependent methyltransferase n=1 Tax=Nibrella saemangeumensis TaxID=1084526 RepID=A0ABP8MZW4_9BACT